MWRCSDELKNRVLQLETDTKKEAKHYIGVVAYFRQTTTWSFVMHFLNRCVSCLKPACMRTYMYLHLNGCCSLVLQLKCHGYNAEFWKTVPATEPFRAILGDIRDKLYQTHERLRQLMAGGKSEIPVEETFTDKSQVLIPNFRSLYCYPVHMAQLKD